MECLERTFEGSLSGFRVEGCLDALEALRLWMVYIDECHVHCGMSSVRYRATAICHVMVTCTRVTHRLLWQVPRESLKLFGDRLSHGEFEAKDVHAGSLQESPLRARRTLFPSTTQSRFAPDEVLKTVLGDVKALDSGVFIRGSIISKSNPVGSAIATSGGGNWALSGSFLSQLDTDRKPPGRDDGRHVVLLSEHYGMFLHAHCILLLNSGMSCCDSCRMCGDAASTSEG